MKQFQSYTFGLALAGLFLAGVTTQAATVNLSVNLTPPKLQSISSPGIGNIPAVQLQFKYDAKGKIIMLAGSGAGTNFLTGTTTLTKAKTGYNFNISAKGTTNKTVTLTLKGSLDTNKIACTYVVGKARVITNLPVTITYVSPVTASFTLNATMDAKGKITGTGSIVSGYGNETTNNGTLKGNLNKSTFTWQLKQGGQQLTFTGKNQTNQYLGNLTVGLPPATGSYKNFVIPAFLSTTTGSNGPAGMVTFAGTVSEASAQGASLPTKAAGVKVTVRADVNGNGVIEANEVSSTTTDSNGQYSLQARVADAGRAVIEFSDQDFAKGMKVVDPVRTNSTVTSTMTLQPLKQMTVTSGNATTSDGKLQLKGLPSTITSLSARVFNPVTEADQFPGDFSDNNKNLLVSSVFTVVDARDKSNNSVTNLGSGSTLRMQVPRDTYSTMKDLQSGNGQIDVPLYYFDENSGQWVRASNNGWLEDSSGTKILENQLASIKDGSYSGTIFVVGTITHLSYWNCDWPIDTHTCIHGVIVDTNNNPVAGATVEVKGLTYNGTTSPKTTGPDGSFCAEVMRSEQANEDINGNGVLGETQQVGITVTAGGNYYKFGPYNTPQAQATCADGTCIELGNLQVNSSNQLAVTFCAITGTMVYSGTTTPVTNGYVYAWDSELDSADLIAWMTNSAFAFYSLTDSNGNFSLNVPVLTGATVWGWGSDSVSTNVVEYAWASQTVSGCPAAPINLQADYYRWFVLSSPAVTNFYGYLYQYQGTVTCTMESFSGTTVSIYAGVVQPNSTATFPTQTGQHLTLDLYGYSNTSVYGKLGTITFTATNPLGGTWSTTGANGLSGTWGDQ